MQKRLYLVATIMQNPRSLLSIITALVLSLNAMGQSASAPGKFWVQFSDKNNSPYSLENPSEFLSEAALQRRANQGIALQWNDLPVNPSYVQQVAATGATVLHRSRWFNGVTVSVSDTSLMQQIRSLPFVNRTSQVARLKIKSPADELMADLMRMAEQLENANTTPPAKAAAALSTFSNPTEAYGEASMQTTMIGIEKLHALGYRGQSIPIAVLDAGFFKVNVFNHFDSLFQNNRILGTCDFVAGGNAVYEDNSHGLSVLSTMAANSPGQIIGTAPQASYWLIRTEDADTEFVIEEDNWVAGAEFADSAGVWIINSSLGYTKFDEPSQNHTYNDLNGNTTRITQGADIAASKGILVVNSVGNSGNDPWKFIGAPADGDSVLTIGAVNAERNYASFSSLGPSADGRIKPNVTAMGQLTYLVVSSGNLARSNGTSFSSPIIAGAAACLWQAHPKAKMMDIFKAIEQSADQYENPDARRGFGIPDFMMAHSILSKAELQGSPTDSLVNVYPNPFIEGLSLEYFSTTEKEIQITVHKASGKKVYQEKVKVYPYLNTPIQLENLRKLSSGIYTVTVNNGKQSFVRRIVKQDD